jgi:hypothetical protein
MWGTRSIRNSLRKNDVWWKYINRQRLKQDSFSVTYGVPEGMP